MAAREQKVTLTIDVEEYVKGMEEATKATDKLTAAIDKLVASKTRAESNLVFNITEPIAPAETATQIAKRRGIRWD